MKTKIILLFNLLIIFVSCYGQAATISQAKEVLGRHFISVLEARTVYPDLAAEIAITFSPEILKFNPNAWLVPIKSNGVSKYFLISANFENEISNKKFLKQNDTLSLNETKQVIKLISSLRPFSWERINSEIPYTYFLRTKNSSPPKQGIGYRKIVAYDNESFLVIDWPNGVEIGVVNKDYISYLTRDKRGREIKFGLAFLPEDHPNIEYLQSIYVLTIFYQKN
jgi:hypothetical protein